MNLIIDAVLDKWKSTRKTKMSPSGWLSGNACCCEHRGETKDTRMRGGIIVSANQINYNCFNCNFGASYFVGKNIYPKFQKLLEWLNFDEKTIKQLKFEALKATNQELNKAEYNKIRREIKPVILPNNCNLLQNDISNHKSHLDFIKSRGFSCEDFPFLVSSDLGFRNRVIVPFMLHDVIVGFSARSIIPEEKSRYIMKLTTDYVFGLDWVEPQHTWFFVTEGIFDALSVKCLAIMHNEINETQTEMICDLQKQVIVVPHLDFAGLKNQGNSLINVALDCGWSVAIPEWKEKDINSAYLEYGSLFVVKHLLEVATSNSTLIRLKQKILLNEKKRK